MEKTNGYTTKTKPGRTNDGHRFKRTLRFDVRLSPIEYEALVQDWIKSECNSMARHVRARLFGESDPIAIYWEQRRQNNHGRLEVLAALGRIGSNVNQIARGLNRYDSKSTAALESELSALKGELSRIAIAQTGDQS